MQALRRYRTFGRLLAAWFVLWFAAMAVSPALLQQVAAAEHEGHHHHHHHHHDEAPGQSDVSTGDSAQPDIHDLHAGHGAGSQQHCPLCMHAAVPPPPRFAPALAEAAPAEAVAAAPRAHPRVRTDVPPPARAPPFLS